MNKLKENKEFIIRYFNALRGQVKTAELCDSYMTDKHLQEHIIFFDTIFPNYEVSADEMTAEGDRVIVRATLKGIHEGEFNGIPPTYRNVEFPFVISYTIKNDKITDHWMIADQMVLMEQLGAVSA